MKKERARTASAKAKRRSPRSAALEKRFEMAESTGLWLHPQNEAERTALFRGASMGDFVIPIRGWYARKEHYESCSLREKAFRSVKSLARSHPTWTFCLFSAAVMHGLQVPYALLSNCHVIGPRPSKRSDSFIHHHSYQVKHQDYTYQLGVRVTSIRRTLLDCLCASSFCHGLAIADSALRWGTVNREELEAHFASEGTGRKGIATARRAISLADGRSENGGESMARAMMIELGFEIPLLQVDVVDPVEPNTSRRADFGWKLPNGNWIIGELDGLKKYTKPGRSESTVKNAVKAMSRERIRESHINLTGATVVRFTLEQALDKAYFERLLITAGVPKRRI